MKLDPKQSKLPPQKFIISVYEEYPWRYQYQLLNK